MGQVSQILTGLNSFISISSLTFIMDTTPKRKGSILNKLTVVVSLIKIPLLILVSIVLWGGVYINYWPNFYKKFETSFNQTISSNLKIEYYFH
jgi:hypothetical protein